MGIPVDEYPDAGPCTENDISVIDTVREEQFNADRRGEYHGPTHRNQFNGSLTYFLDTGAGSHNFKFGGQASREYLENRSFKNGDALGKMEDGVPKKIEISRTPTTNHARLNTWAAYAQDAWTIGGRLTLNLGVRFDGIYGYVPAQSSPDGTWAALSQELAGGDIFSVPSDITGLPDWPMNIGPRASFAFDLFGDGRAALKGGWGRYYTQMGVGLASGANPNAGSSAEVGWNDIDGDRLVDLGPSGTLADSPELDLSEFNGFTGGASTEYDDNAKRPYSDDISLGVDMTLGGDISASVTYHRRSHRDSLGHLNRARPPSAYDQISFECEDCPGTYTGYALQEAYRGLQDNVITNVDALKSDYNGVAIQIQKRFSNRWQMLGGATFSSHKGVPPRFALRPHGMEQSKPAGQSRQRLGADRPPVGGELRRELSRAVGHPVRVELSVARRESSGRHCESRGLDPGHRGGIRLSARRRTNRSDHSVAGLQRTQVGGLGRCAHRSRRRSRQHLQLTACAESQHELRFALLDPPLALDASNHSFHGETPVLAETHPGIFPRSPSLQGGGDQVVDTDGVLRDCSSLRNEALELDE